MICGVAALGLLGLFVGPDLQHTPKFLYVLNVNFNSSTRYDARYALYSFLYSAI
jgi:hypothetical protein